MKTYTERKEFFSQNNKLNKGYKAAKKEHPPMEVNNNNLNEAQKERPCRSKYICILYAAIIFIIGVAVGMYLKK